VDCLALNILPHCLINGKFFGTHILEIKGKFFGTHILEIKCVLIFSAAFA
jgi:hypothetical protein